MTKNAYLTIDDAPSADFRRKVDLLQRLNVPAIFFCSGNLLEQRPAEAIEALRKGFILGNHAYNHPHFSEITLEEGFEQIRRTDELLERLYQHAGILRTARYFRFPYGDKGALNGSEVYAPPEADGAARKARLQAYLRELGYHQAALEGVTYRHFRQAGLLEDVDWYWTYDVMDWTVFKPQPLYGIDSLEKLLARMDEVEPEVGRGLNTPGSDEIILTHDHEATAPFFEALVKGLLAKGLVFRLPIFTAPTGQ